MAHDNPRRITKQKLLRFNAQQLECQSIRERLASHDRAVAALNSMGYRYDPATGTIQPKKGQNQ